MSHTKKAMMKPSTYFSEWNQEDLVRGKWGVVTFNWLNRANVLGDAYEVLQGYLLQSTYPKMEGITSFLVHRWQGICNPVG